MTVTLEELIVDLARDSGRERTSEQNGIDRRIVEHFDLSDIRQRRTYLLCFSEELSDVLVGLRVLDMKGRDNALIGDLLTLKAHADRYGRFSFPVVCRGSWVTLQRRIHYPCLRADESGQCALIELIPGTDFWPADTRFLLVDKPA